MTVVVTLSTGEKFHLDRNLSRSTVFHEINEYRGTGRLIEFDDDRTPRGQKVCFDPDLVSSVVDDGHPSYY